MDIQGPPLRRLARRRAPAQEVIGECRSLPFGPASSAGGGESDELRRGARGMLTHAVDPPPFLHICPMQMRRICLVLQHKKRHRSSSQQLRRPLFEVLEAGLLAALRVRELPVHRRRQHLAQLRPGLLHAQRRHGLRARAVCLCMRVRACVSVCE
jgi:hypothetical protein